MVKRPSLAENMKAVQGASVQAATAPQPEPAARPAGPGSGYYAATREGKKKAQASLTPDEHRRLKRLSVDTDRTIEELMLEAVMDLFAKHGA
jgi:hypothetical protein